MFDYKDLSCGCAILCADSDPRTFLTTFKSIKNYADAPCIAIAPKSITKIASDDIKKHCELYKGGNTYTSLINTALQKIKHDWCFVVIAGSVIKSKVIDRYSRFVESDKDILYPVMRLEEGPNVIFKTNFVDGSLNGLLLHTNALKIVGKMPDISDIEQVKLAWANEALVHGYRFKGILGSRIVG